MQALEAWTGIDLVNGSSSPTRLTPAGETFHADAVRRLTEGRCDQLIACREYQLSA